MIDNRKRIDLTSEQVLEKLREAEEKGKLEEVVYDIFMKYEMDMVIIWKCRDFLDKLSEESVQKNPMIIPYRAIIEAMRGNTKKAEAIVKSYGREFEESIISSFGPLDFSRIMLEMVMPQLRNDEFIRREKFLVSVCTEPIRGLALNACRPSIINGFRDFTMYCPYMESKHAEIEKVIEVLYGNSGKGVYDVAVAEWNYETGDAFKALIGVAAIIPRLDEAKDIRCLFVAYVLQIKILTLNGQNKDSKELYEKIRKRILENNYEELVSSLRAAECMQLCYSADIEGIKEWLKEDAPNENEEIFMMDMFSYFTKMRCYLQLGDYMLTIILAKRLLEMLSRAQRPHDDCECHILLAIASYMAGDKENAVYEMENAFEIANSYNYVRLFADEGQIMVELLKLYKAKTKTEVNEDRIKLIKGIALEVARRFPNYLTAKEEIVTLTKTERRVLDLIAEGLSNEAIGEELHKKEGAIKYHASNIYKKFNVSNRQQAINYARQIGMI